MANTTPIHEEEWRARQLAGEKPFDWEKKFDEEFIDISKDRTLWKFKKNVSVGQIRYFIRILSNQNKRLNEAFEERMNRELERQREKIMEVIYRIKQEFANTPLDQRNIWEWIKKIQEEINKL